MATPGALLLLLLLLLLLGQPRAGAGAHSEALVCAGTACYTAHWARLSATEAQSSCSARGGNLATVKSEDEAQHVQKALAQLLQFQAPLAARMGKFWVGLHRDKGKCLDPDLPLRGFSWVGGGEDTAYTNWPKEFRSSCTSRRCVSLVLDLSLTPDPGRLPKWSEGPCGSPGLPGSSIEGFVCKFSFPGMCQPLTLRGPGRVTYHTVLGDTTDFLEAVPLATSASVACGDRPEGQDHYLLCRKKGPQLADWDSPGSLCASPTLSCSFQNGGCEQECFEGGHGSSRCGCWPGFRLQNDLVTCVSRDPCHSSPCQGQATCQPGPDKDNFTCRCPDGYQLDATQRGCEDVDECQGAPCAQECVNTPGGFRCECWVGFKPGSPGEMACHDVDECAQGHSPCAQGCTNTFGSFSCFCEPGYVLSGADRTQCEDVDECAHSQGRPCSHLCLNTRGSFTCSCPPGWKLTPGRVNCTLEPVSPTGPAGPVPGEAQGRGTQGPVLLGTVSRPTGSLENSPAMSRPASSPEVISTVPRPTSGSKGIVPRVPSTGWSSSLSDGLTTSVLPGVSVPSRYPDLWTEPGTHTSKATTGHVKPMSKDSVLTQGNRGTDGQKLLLFYILGTVVAISLLLVLALGLLVCRKRRARREMKKKPQSQSAADSYSWVPEHGEGRTAENPYSPTPGSDC
ncbi:complement component C1q receptor [Ctenodactylus gundi]